jgi:hypothetical protein
MALKTICQTPFERQHIHGKDFFKCSLQIATKSTHRFCCFETSLCYFVLAKCRVQSFTYSLKTEAWKHFAEMLCVLHYGTVCFRLRQYLHRLVLLSAQIPQNGFFLRMLIIFFNSYSGGWNPYWVDSARRPLNGPLPAPGDCDDGKFGGMMIGRGNRSIGRKPSPAPLCPPQIPLDQTRAITRAAAVGSQGLSAWAMARPMLIVTQQVKKFPASFSETRIFIVFTRVLHWSLFRFSWTPYFLFVSKHSSSK